MINGIIGTSHKFGVCLRPPCTAMNETDQRPRILRWTLRHVKIEFMEGIARGLLSVGYIPIDVH